MYLIEQLLPAVAVAAATAAAWAALGLRATGAGASVWRSLAASAVGIGYCAGHIFITGWTAFPPTDTTNWLPYFALATVAAGLVASFLPTKVTRHVVFGVICVGAMRLLLAPKFQHGWTAMQGWLWAGGLSIIALLVALAQAALTRRSSVALEPPLILITLATGTAGALMLSGSLLLGQFAAVLAAAIVGSYCLSSRRRIEDDNGLDGMACGFSLLLIALLACGSFFAELPLLSAALLAAAVPAAALLIPMEKFAPRWAIAVRLAIIVVTTSGAMLIAFRSSPPWSD